MTRLAPSHFPASASYLGRLAALALLLLSLSPQAHTQQPPATAAPTPDVRPLELQRPVEREIKAGEVHAYGLTLSEGQFLRVVVVPRAERNVPAVTAFGPDGAKLIEVAGPQSSDATRQVSLVAGAAGAYRVEVRPQDGKAEAARYELRVAELRAAAPADKAVVAADRILAEAGALAARRKAEDTRQAMAKYEEALPLLRSSGDRLREAAVLHKLGLLASDQLDETRKALEYFQRALPLWRAVGHR